MKKIYLLALLLLPFLAHSQTITQADLPTAGIAFTMNVDTNYVAPIPAGGTGQVWNYSTLLTNSVDSQAFQSAVGTPYAATFPTSNLVMYQATDDSYLYLTNSSTGLYFDGSASAGLSFMYDQPLLFIPVPFSYGSMTTSSARIVVDTVLAGVGYRIVIRVDNTFEGDGTGTLTTPMGTYNVLRIKNTQLTYDSASVEAVAGSGIYFPVSSSVGQTTDYLFLSSGNPVNIIMTLNADSLGTMSTSSQYFSGQFTASTQNLSMTKKTTAYPNPAFDNIRFSMNDLNAEVIIYDNSGKEVNRINGNMKNSVGVQSLNSGVYHYKAIFKDRTESGSFVVQH